MIREAGSRYTDDENLLVLELFMNLDYRSFRETNVEVVALSNFLRENGYNRSPGSVKAKLENLKSVNPEYTKDGKTGLPKICKYLKSAWSEYECRGFSTLTQDAADARSRISGGKADAAPSIPSDDDEEGWILFDLPEGKEREALVTVRLNQRDFRKRVLASYGSRCCITGMTGSDLLVASHIKPWRACKNEEAWQRLDPGNGLCLNALHDQAFDRGLMTLDRNMKVELSPIIEQKVDRSSMEIFFEPFDRKRISLPSKAQIKTQYIDYHREFVFIS